MVPGSPDSGGGGSGVYICVSCSKMISAIATMALVELFETKRRMTWGEFPLLLLITQMDSR